MRSALYHPLKYLTLVLLFCVSIFDVSGVMRYINSKRTNFGERTALNSSNERKPAGVLIMSGKTSLP